MTVCAADCVCCFTVSIFVNLAEGGLHVLVDCPDLGHDIIGSCVGRAHLRTSQYLVNTDVLTANLVVLTG